MAFAIRFFIMLFVLNFALVCGGGAAKAQPQPLSVDPYNGEPYDSGAYTPEGYVPLPDEADMPPQDDMTAVAAAEFEIPADEMDMAAAPVDPLQACHDTGSDVDGCLKDRRLESERALESAAMAARAAASDGDETGLRRLTASNMAFTTFRDAECLRQQNNVTGDESGSMRLAQACAIILNELRSTMLRGR